MAVTVNGDANVRIALFTQLTDQVAQIDFHLSAATPTPGKTWSSADFFTAFLGSAVEAAFAQLLSNNANYLGLKLWYNPTAGAVFVDQSIAGAAPGAAGVNNLPGQCCGLISWTSALGGKIGRGRTYLPFLSPASAGTTGGVTAGYQGDVLTFINLMLTGFVVPNTGTGGGSLTLRIGTKYTVGTPALPFQYLTGVASPDVATQRRRGAFGRQNRPPL